MSEPVEYVTLEDLLAMIDAELGARLSVVRDLGLLAAAVDRHAAVVFGEDVYPRPRRQGSCAPALPGRLPPADRRDNNRLGTLAMPVLYGLNGMRVDATDDELYDLVSAIAHGTQRDVERIADELRAWEVRPAEGQAPPEPGVHASRRGP